MASYYMAKEDFYSYESDSSHGGDQNLVGEDGDYGVQPWYGDDYTSSEYEDDPGGEEGEPEPPDRCPTRQHHTETQTATTTSIPPNTYVYEDECEPEGDLTEKGSSYATMLVRQAKERVGDDYVKSVVEVVSNEIASPDSVGDLDS